MQIGVLGPFEVRCDDGTTADVPGVRLRALVVALALEPGRVVPKATLIDWIWGENPPTDTANALQRLVSRLRKALPDGAVEGRIGGYRLMVAPDAVDAVRFEHLLARARREEGPGRLGPLRDALASWRGAAMQDVVLEDSAALDAAVARLDGLRMAAMEDRFDAEVAAGHGAEVVGELTDAVTAHPLRERLVAALMRALVVSGRDAEALLAYERTRDALADALGADPSPELSAVHVAILRGELARPDGSRRTNVRAELTSFVGRDADVAAVRGLVGRHRLTTLVGSGGAGKTRLATETARTMVGDAPDGVWLVELAAIGADGDEGGGPEGQGGGRSIAQATLTALGLRDALLGAAPSADPLDGLVAAVREREPVLILDNCEHVIDAAATFADRVLGDCPGLRIVATSREPLGITGEALWSVEPLAVPADADRDSPAVRMLRDRAGAVRRDLGGDDHTDMVRICRAVDGMPLAIELAAARLRTMTVGQLARRLDDRFRLLASGSRTALPRHRTLRAVIDWSWELLTDAERTALRRLSVFSGGAGLEGAERVCAGDAVEPDEVLAVLTSLVEKSLLVVEGDDAPRYRMLGTIKEYAAERLADAGEADQARRAHLAWLVELTETAEPHLRRSEQLQWLATLAAEHDEIGAAMRGAVAAGEAQPAMRLAAGAGWYWWLCGHRAEGIDLMIAATEVPGEVSDNVRAVVYALVAAFVTSGRADANEAAEWIRQAYRFTRLSRHPNPLLGLVTPLERMLQSPGESVPAFESLSDHDDDPWVRAMARLQLGKMRIVLGRGDREAEANLEKALVEFQALGERFGISFALSELGEFLAVRGELAEACEHYARAIAVVAEVGAVEDVIRLRTRQAVLYRVSGDPAAAAAAIADAERSADGVTWPAALVEVALAKAELARLGDDGEEARRQLAVATTLMNDDDSGQTNVRATIHDLLGYLTDDPGEARTHRAAAWQAASVAGHAPLIAQVLVGVADLATRVDQPEQAARLLAAGVGVRGQPDHSHPDADRIEQEARRRLGEARFAEATREGGRASPSELVEITLGA